MNTRRNVATNILKPCMSELQTRINPRNHAGLSQEQEMEDRM